MKEIAFPLNVGSVMHNVSAVWPALVFTAALAVSAPAWGDEAGERFFETHVRPLLIEHCYACHSVDGEKGVKGSLLLDSREGWSVGGDSGPAIVPGEPGQSLLIAAIRYANDELQMPPKSKLSAQAIAMLEEWVAMGAPDPREGGGPVARAGIDMEAGRRFWAFQRPRRHTPPTVADGAWPRSDIDRFILAELEARQMRPVRDADRRTLIRRVYFDLVGLPPRPEEVQAFVDDASADALEKVVDRLLASPHFGERWGRHWLDVARFAESVGGGRTTIFEQAWRYRDYVVDAFNGDKPYDQFVREQIAGDQLPADSPERADQQLIATGLLALGPKNLDGQNKEQLDLDVIDEQLDTIGQALMGMTLGCARCHDHKFDPIPHTDYHALGGIFASTKLLEHANVSRLVTPPLPSQLERHAAHQAYAGAVRDLEAQQRKLTAEIAKLDKAEESGAAKLAGIVVDDTQAMLRGSWQYSTFSSSYVGEGYLHDEKAGKGGKSATFTPSLADAGLYEVRIAYNAAASREARVPVTIHAADGTHTIHLDQQRTPSIDRLFEPVGRFRFEAGEGGSVTISNAQTTGFVIVDAVQFVPVDGAADAGAALAAGRGADEKVQQRRGELEGELADVADRIKRLKAEAAPAAEVALAAMDAEQPGDMVLRIRGEVGNLGPVIPRGFLSVIDVPVPAIAGDRSGRLELAWWLTAADHPLTARVMINRIWHHLFGAGLVRTVDNFGSRGEEPSHPALLDTLAVEFVEDGWSVKRAIRRMVLSRVYGLSSDHDEGAWRIDPENRLLWRVERRRLDAEAMRDAILAISGSLDLTMGGPTIERPITTEFNYHVDRDCDRRSIYLPVFRNSLPELFEVFDFPDPNLVQGKRGSSTLATQALYLLNSPFVMRRSRQAAERLVGEAWGEGERIERVYEVVLGRGPAEAERRIIADYLERMRGEGGQGELEAWAAVVRSLLACIDFRYLN